MNIMTNYMKEILARLKSDDAAVIAAKNERKSNSALKGQIAALEAKKVDDESAVEDAEEALKVAKFPTSVITDNSSYIRNIKQAEENLASKKETLTSTTESIAYFNAILEEFK